MKYALMHCNVLDGTEKMELQRNQTLIIEDDRIIGIESGVCRLKDATLIDVEGKYVLPGLINLHVHLAGNGKPKRAKGVTNISKWVEKYSFMQKGIQDTVKKHLEMQLYSGVTSVRSLGEIGHADLVCRDQIRNKMYLGPRVWVAGYGVTSRGGHMAGSMAKVCEEIVQSKELVQEESEVGVDWIKLFVTGGVLDAISEEEPTVVKLPLKIASAACKKAHQLGYKVAAHAQSMEGVKNSLLAGVDTIEHGSKMDEEIVGLYKQNQEAMVATFSPAVAIANLSQKETKMTDLQKKASQTLIKNMIIGIEQALANDIPVGLGTDSGCPYVTHYDMWIKIHLRLLSIYEK